MLSPTQIIQIEAELELRKRNNPEEFEKIRDDVGIQIFTEYQNDPVGFGEKILGDTYTDDVKRMMESVRDYPITVARSSNGVGKTHGAGRVALWFYKCFPDSQVYTACAPPESNLRRLLWGEIGSIARKNEDLFKQDRVMSLHISRTPNSFLTGVTIPSSGTPEQREAKFSGKHAPYILFIVDEGDAVPEEVYKGIESCMSGGHARLLIMFNPRWKAGEVWRMERDGHANVVELKAFNHPNVLTGENVIPGAVDRETTVRRINEWSRPLAGGEHPDMAECFEVPDFLVGAVANSKARVPYPPLQAGTRRVTESSLFYMTLATYPAQAEQQLISTSWVERAINRWLTYVQEYGENPPNYAQPLAGLDVAEMGRDFNSLCFRYGGFVDKLYLWNGVDPDATAIHASAVCSARQTVTVYVDATGVGAGVAPRMMREGSNEAVGVKVASSPTYELEFGVFSQLRDQLWWSMREWLRLDPSAMLPPDEELKEELTIPQYAVLGGKIKVSTKDEMKALLGRSPDRAESLMLTFLEDDYSAEWGTSPFGNYRG